MEPTGRRLLRIVPDVTDALALSKSSVYREIEIGRLRSVRIGGSVRVDERDLVEYVDRMRSGQRAPSAQVRRKVAAG